MRFEEWIEKFFEDGEYVPEEVHPKIEEIFAACEEVKQVGNYRTDVYIPEVYNRLEKKGIQVPPSVVFYTLKVAEHFNKCRDIGEGFFSWL